MSNKNERKMSHEQQHHGQRELSLEEMKNVVGAGSGVPGQSRFLASPIAASGVPGQSRLSIYGASGVPGQSRWTL